jgi:DNA repair exonuclease SbcCD ATPase subunit
MGFFTIGNLITLGIVALALFLYRMMDKDNRSLDKVRKYAEKCKDDIAAYAEEKRAAVKDFGIALDIERKSAIELMHRLQSVTEQELAEKAKAINALEEQLKTYDSSLEGLVSVTEKVQENLNRIKTESGFVDIVGKRLADTRDKLEQFEKNLSTLENRFERENCEALETLTKEIMVSVRSAVSDLEISADGIEQQVEEHRQAIEKIERSRDANITRDTELINTVLSNAVGHIESKAAEYRQTIDEAEHTRSLAIAGDTEHINKVLSNAVEHIESKAEEYRQAVIEAEHSRSATIAGDIEQINKVLKDALERAGSRAGKMEDVALVKLRDQAQERLNLLKTAWEEKIKAAQDVVKSRLTENQELLKTKVIEIQDQIKATRDGWKNESSAVQDQIHAELAEIQEQVKTSMDSWKTECNNMENRQKAYRGEWENSVRDLEAIAAQQRDGWARVSWETEQRIIAASGERLEEYKAVQAEQFRQLDTLANDAGRLEAELRQLMQDAVNRVTGDFSQFRDEASRKRESVEAEFNTLVQNLRANLDTVEQELSGIKDQARQNVSEKLKLFEDDFYADLEQRSSSIESLLSGWQNEFNTRISEIAREGEEERKQIESRFTTEARRGAAEQGEKILGELERLKAQAGALEEGIRGQMQAADETCVSFREQLSRDLDEARASAQTGINSQIGQYSLAMSETIRRNQRDLDEQLRALQTRVDAWNTETQAAAEASRRNIQEWQNQYSAQMRDMDDSLEEVRRRSRDMAAENDERITQLRDDIDVIRRELSAQEKLFDQTGKLKHDLERSIEDLNGDIDRLDQRRNEIIQMENQFVQIKRMEDDVNAKMTRFLSEKRRIEVMEADFNRLLKTSQEVDDKLVQVSASDDTLQAVLVQIRRLEASLTETEDKYQRVEKKNQILDEINDGINRNFKSLQEGEAAVKKAGDDIERIFGELTNLRESVGALAGECERARDAADKLGILDEALPLLEKRIAEMQVAREWLARTETELMALDKDAQTQLRLIRSLLDRENKKATGGGKGAPPVRDREIILKLRRKGWTTEEIANSLNYSIGEVELTLEFEKLDK